MKNFSLKWYVSALVFLVLYYAAPHITNPNIKAVVNIAAFLFLVAAIGGIATALYEVCKKSFGKND